MSDTHLPAKSTQQVDNERVRVTEWRIPPGGATGWHTHEFDYVIVPTVGGNLRIETPDGEAVARMVTGESYFRAAGVEHDVINNDDHEIVFIETEVK